MHSTTLTFRTTTAWWINPYLHLLMFFCVLMDMEPNYEKVGAIVMRGIKVDLVEQ